MKSEKFIINSTLACASIGFLGNLLYQWQKMYENPNIQFDYESLLDTSLKAGILGFGASSSVVIINALTSSLDASEESEDIKPPTSHLRDVLASHQTDAVPETLLGKAQNIMNILECVYGDKLVRPPRFQGSLARKTNLKHSSDIDILLSFKSNSFETLEDMYEDVYCTLKQCIKDASIQKVRRQKVSLGLIFNFQGESFVIDVVPSRKTDQNPKNNEYSLYKSSMSYWSKSSWLKMNPEIQQDLGDNAKNKQDVISLLKLFNNSIGKPMKSILIRAFVHRVFNYFGDKIPRNLNQKVVAAMDYIANNIETARVTAVDNSNIVLTESLSDNEKHKIASVMRKTACELENNPSSFAKYFQE